MLTHASIFRFKSLKSNFISSYGSIDTQLCKIKRVSAPR